MVKHTLRDLKLYVYTQSYFGPIPGWSLKIEIPNFWAALNVLSWGAWDMYSFFSSQKLLRLEPLKGFLS